MRSKQRRQIVDPDKLTSWEWEALGDGYNIADGHAHQSQSLEYLKIIKNLPQLYLEAERGKQKEIQNRFEKAFVQNDNFHYLHYIILRRGNRRKIK